MKNNPIVLSRSQAFQCVAIAWAFGFGAGYLCDYLPRAWKTEKPAWVAIAPPSAGQILATDPTPATPSPDPKDEIESKLSHIEKTIDLEIQICDLTVPPPKGTKRDLGRGVMDMANEILRLCGIPPIIVKPAATQEPDDSVRARSFRLRLR